MRGLPPETKAPAGGQRYKLQNPEVFPPKLRLLQRDSFDCVEERRRVFLVVVTAGLW
jgi:hypothetical protein